MKIREVRHDRSNLSQQELVYLRRAWHAAKTSTERQRHGAILVVGRKTIAIGCNTFRNSPSNVSNPGVESSFHAEGNVLKQVGNREKSKDGRVFVVRINNVGMLMPSRPCDKCLARMALYGIKEVIHS